MLSKLEIFTRDEGDKQITKHFKAKEFFCKCGTCHNQLIDIGHVSRLEILRQAINKPIKINSGFRCEKHNKIVGGTENSQHCKGTATDIVISDKTPEEVSSVADFLGFRGIGVYNTFTHIDSRNGKRGRWNG